MDSTYIHRENIGEGVINRLFTAERILKVTDEVPEFQLNTSKPFTRALHRVDPKLIDLCFRDRGAAKLLLEKEITGDPRTPSAIQGSIKLEDAPRHDSPLRFQLKALAERPSIYKIHFIEEIPNTQEKLSREELKAIGDFIFNVITLSTKKNESEKSCINLAGKLE